MEILFHRQAISLSLMAVADLPLNHQEHEIEWSVCKLDEGWSPVRAHPEGYCLASSADNTSVGAIPKDVVAGLVLV